MTQKTYGVGDWIAAAVIGVIFLVMYASCSGGGNEAYVQSAEFRTLTACRIGIQKNSKQFIDRIITDKPHKVSGFLSNGKTFTCERKETGTKGVYWSGWYMTE